MMLRSRSSFTGARRGVAAPVNQYLWEAADYAEDTEITDAGWTLEDGTPTVSRVETVGGVKVWKENRSTNSSRYYHFTAVPVSGDVNMHWRFQKAASGAESLKYLSGWYGTNGPTDGYRIGADSWQHSVFLFTAGSFISRLNSSNDPNPAGDIWLQAKVQITATHVRFRLWEESGSEPGTWTLESADTTHRNKPVGLAVFHGDETRIAWFGVGTNGEAAPTP